MHKVSKGNLEHSDWKNFPDAIIAKKIINYVRQNFILKDIKHKINKNLLLCLLATSACTENLKMASFKISKAWKHGDVEHREL